MRPLRRKRLRLRSVFDWTSAALVVWPAVTWSVGCTLYDRDLIEHAHLGAGGRNPGRGGGTALGAGGTGGLGAGLAGTTTTGSDVSGSAGQENVENSAGSGGVAVSAAGGRLTVGAGGASEEAGVPGAGPQGGEAGGSGASEGGSAEAGAPSCSAPRGCACDGTESACTSLVTSLAHRYAFDGSGASVHDVAGGADGVVHGGALLAGDGTLTLASAAADYVELPPHCVSTLASTTIELWFEWDASGDAWQHVFDFGQASDATTGTALWFSPEAQNTTTGTARAAYGATGYTNEILVNGPALGAGAYHVAVVVDTEQNMLSLYLNGAFSGAQAFPSSLPALAADDCWLGRSHFETDPYFGGTLDEVRIYDAALSAADLAFSDAVGPNPPFL